MPDLRTPVAAILAVTLTACGNPNSEVAADTQLDTVNAEQGIATAAIILADGTSAGELTLLQTGETLSLKGSLANIPAGPHGFHLHTVGDCETPDFKSAEGHLNPDNATHGKESEGGKHLGDLDNLVVDDSGEIRIDVQIEGTATESLPHIMDADGTAVMIHADADDYTSDPAGAAGPRIACGILGPVSPGS